MSRRAVAGLEGSVWPSSLQQIMSPTASQHQVILPRPGDSLEMIEQVLETCMWNTICQNS